MTQVWDFPSPPPSLPRLPVSSFLPPGPRAQVVVSQFQLQLLQLCQAGQGGGQGFGGGGASGEAMRSGRTRPGERKPPPLLLRAFPGLPSPLRPLADLAIPQYQVQLRELRPLRQGVGQGLGAGVASAAFGRQA